MDARTRNQISDDRGYSKQNPDEIKRDIDRTRAHLDSSVVALSQRLSPRRLADEFIDTFTGRGDGRQTRGFGGIAGEGGQILRSIRDHPVPAVLIGAGVTWFFVGRMRSQGLRGSIPDEVGRQDERDWLAPGATYHEHKGEDTGEGLSRKAGEVARSGREHVAEGGRKMRDMAHRAGESISHAGHAVKDRLHSAREHMGHRGGEGLKDKASKASHTLRDVIDDHPLAVGAAALAVGLLAGLAAPSTRGERRVMGELRDEVAEKARRSMKEVGSRVRETAMAAAHAGAEGAMGGSSEAAGEQLSHSATEGIHRAGEAVREELRSARQSDEGGGEKLE